MIALAILLCLAGFVALCLSMSRHHETLIGGRPTTGRRLALRAAGWSALGLGAWASVRAWGPTYGVIGWLGLLTLSAAIVLLALTYWRLLASRRPKP
jgi:hypothetical protein